MDPVRRTADPGAAAEALERRRRREAIRGFEEMFVAQLLKSMRRSVPVEGEPGTKQLWQERFDAEIARTIAESGGVGLAPLVEKGIGEPSRRK